MRILTDPTSKVSGYRAGSVQLFVRVFAMYSTIVPCPKPKNLDVGSLTLNTNPNTKYLV